MRPARFLLHDPQCASQAWHVRPVEPAPLPKNPVGHVSTQPLPLRNFELRHSTQNVELLHDPQWAWQAWQIRPVAPTPSLKYPRGQTSTQSPLLRSFESRHSRQSVGLLQDPQCASQICFRMQITCHVSVRDCTAVMSTAWLESNSHPAGASEMFRPKIKHFE
eukprot:CAMPEP_0117499458 /NCGR_PEP_ID=MMETSP0784-20121206/22256_1 /TAXON_ID=39447 /ORGANISM="" /LENGTH=162 /DNA_ID=CAMNT_0005294607 /DNA_START=805 /DNA_END=1293 /DNA_ORIENTATION=-